MVLGKLIFAELVIKFPTFWMRKTKVHYRVLKSPSVAHILTHTNPHQLCILRNILVLSYKLCLRLSRNSLSPVLCFKIGLLGSTNP